MSESFQLIETVGEFEEATRPGEPLLEDHLNEREKEQRVGLGPDRQMPIRECRGLRAPGIDQDDLPASGPDVQQPLPDLRRGHETAVRRQRIRPENQEVHGSIDIGDRQHQLMPVHQE